MGKISAMRDTQSNDAWDAEEELADQPDDQQNIVEKVCKRVVLDFVGQLAHSPKTNNASTDRHQVQCCVCHTENPQGFGIVVWNVKMGLIGFYIQKNMSQQRSW